MASKLAEGNALMASADKAAKKTFFSKPDWDTAGREYEKAGNCFKAARAFEQAIDAFIKASDAMFKADAVYLAAKAMESAGLVANQQSNDMVKAGEFYNRASDLYQAHGAVDKAAEMLEKAGKANEDVNVDKSIEYYLMACTMYEQEDRARFALETFKRTLAVLLKNKIFPKAIEFLWRMAEVMEPMANKSALYKVYLSTVIVALEMKDEVEAGKRFEAFLASPGFAQSDECRAAGQLLEAYENMDQEMLQSVVNQQTFNFLDNEVTRVARQLRVPGAGSAPTPSMNPSRLQAAAAVPRQPLRPSSTFASSQQPPPSSSEPTELDARPSTQENYEEDDMC